MRSFRRHFSDIFPTTSFRRDLSDDILSYEIISDDILSDEIFPTKYFPTNLSGYILFDEILSDDYPTKSFRRDIIRRDLSDDILSDILSGDIFPTSYSTRFFPTKSFQHLFDEILSHDIILTSYPTISLRRVLSDHIRRDPSEAAFISSCVHHQNVPPYCGEISSRKLAPQGLCLFLACSILRYISYPQQHSPAAVREH